MIATAALARREHGITDAAVVTLIGAADGPAGRGRIIDQRVAPPGTSTSGPTQ
ncbi:MAG TPA: hypothetical protein VJ418_38570 [Streptosporangiaceae bacterium]|nr:hypothetical protein [Streptosporangiaceae bacterium]